MPDPVPGSPEHAASMLAKARGITYEDALKQFQTAAAPAPATSAVTPPAADKPVRPEHIPEKFWDAEKGTVNTDALAKSYAELEKKQSSGAPADATAVAPVSGTVPVIETPPAVDPAVAKQVAFKAASEKATAEHAKDGKLTAETYKSLSDLGYPKDVVDSYIAGQAALQSQYNSGIFNAAGGKDEYFALTGWAKAALKPEEIQGFNAVLRAGNLEATKIAVQGLKARFDATVGKSATTTVQPTNVDAASAQSGYTSRQEMIADMANPKYQKGDPAFHAQVRAKMQAAIRNKVDLGLNIMVTR